jgi:hypothetical protein
LVINSNFVHYNVSDIHDLGIILNHVKIYPLLTFKSNMVIIFTIIRELMLNKKHLTLDGILLIIGYINLLNNPIKAERVALIENELGKIPHIILPPIAINVWPAIQSPWGVIGFIIGEGSFTYISVSNTLVFELSQSTWDYYVLRTIAFYLGLSSSNIIHNNLGISKLRISNFNLLKHIIIPFLCYSHY